MLPWRDAMELMEAMADEVVAAGGTRPVLIRQDIMMEDAAQLLRDVAYAGFGRVDILVNNAGGSRVLPIDAAEERWEEAMTLNFTRQRQLAHALLPKMIDQRWGRIINITGKSEPEHLNGAFSAKAARACLGEGTVARGRAIRHHDKLDSARPHHERADPPQLSGGFPQNIRRDGNPGALLG